MSRLTHHQKLLRLLKQFKLPYKEHMRPDLMQDDAIDEGATLVVAIRDVIDIYFDKSGNYIGTATDEIESFRL